MSADDGLALAVELTQLTGGRLEFPVEEQLPAADEYPGLVVLGSHKATPAGHVAIGGIGERLVYGGSFSVAVAPSGFSKHRPRHIERIGLYRANGGAYALEVADRLAEATGGGLKRFRPPGDEPDAIEDPGSEVDLLVFDSASYAPLRQVLLDERAEWVIGRVRCPVLITPRLPSP